MNTIETELRLILKRHFPEMILVSLTKDLKRCFLDHGDGVKGIVPSEAIYNLGASECRSGG